MDWDMKTSSSQWDWDNLMLFPNRVADIGKKAQWETETSATAGGGSGGSGHAGMDSGSMQNGSVYSSGCGSGSTFGYGSSSKSSVSVDFSAKSEPDQSKVKVESMEPGYVEDRNLGFLELRSQIDHSRTEEPEAGKSSEIRPNGELHIIKHGFSTKEQQESQRSYAGKEIGKMDRNNDAPTVSVSSGLAWESQIGLKLGKRTYFEDASASGGPIKATTPLAIPASSASVPAKKSRGLNQSMQTPRCQVEGCNTDLSSSKDYHRRHKVCEIHSKSAKVTVNGQEQRFCQQCSRFHVLSEFDDGKRSCRRRLAGHNERRRKPQPDSMALNSARLGSSFYDSNRSGFLMDRSSFMHPRIFSSSVLDGHNDFKLGHCKGTWPRLFKTEDQLIFDGHLQTPPVNRQSYPNALSRQHADRLLLLLQSNKAASGDVLNQSIHSYTQSPANSVTQALTLSSSSGTAVLGGLEMASATESLSGVSDSGRALSLLSSQSWGSRAPGSASLDLSTRPGYTLEQFMHDNHSSMTQMPVQGMQHNFGLVADKFLSMSSQSSTGLVSNGYATSGVSSVDKAHQGGSLISSIGGIGNFESPMHGFLQGQELRSSQDARSKDVRRTIDLMQRSSQTQNNESQEQSGVMQHGNGQYMEFQLMRSYEPSVFDSQHM